MTQEPNQIRLRSTHSVEYGMLLLLLLYGRSWPEWGTMMSNESLTGSVIVVDVDFMGQPL